MIVVTNRIPVAEGHKIDFEDRFDEAVPWYERGFLMPGRDADARARSNLAGALQQARLGDISTQVRRAIALHEGTLTVQRAGSIDWATTQHNLGYAGKACPLATATTTSAAPSSASKPPSPCARATHIR